MTHYVGQTLLVKKNLSVLEGALHGKTLLEGEAFLVRETLILNNNNFEQADVQHEFLILNVKASAKTFVKEK